MIDSVKANYSFVFNAYRQALDVFNRLLESDEFSPELVVSMRDVCLSYRRVLISFYANNSELFSDSVVWRRFVDLASVDVRILYDRWHKRYQSEPYFQKLPF